MDRVLFVTTIGFRPPFNGGTTYSNALFEALRANYDVDVIVLKDERRFTQEMIHKAATFQKALTSPIPLNVIYHSGKCKASRHDLSVYSYIIVDHIEAALWIQRHQCRHILIAHNLESRLVGDKLRNPFLRRIFDLRNRLERYELSSYSTAAGIICISATERDVIAHSNPQVVQLLPAFAAPLSTYTNSDILRFGFIGPSSWPPNYRTVETLARDVLPNVNRTFEFVLAGTGWQCMSQVLPERTLKLGFVKDLDKFWSGIDILLAPTQQGAGVNVKICEALHHGINVITNTESAIAIFGDAPMPKNLQVANNPEDLAALLDEIEVPTKRVSCPAFSQTVLRNDLQSFLESLYD